MNLKFGGGDEVIMIERLLGRVPEQGERIHLDFEIEVMGVFPDEPLGGSQYGLITGNIASVRSLPAEGST